MYWFQKEIKKLNRKKKSMKKIGFNVTYKFLLRIGADVLTKSGPKVLILDFISCVR